MRKQTLVPPDDLIGKEVAIDGYNVLLTLEAALSNGVLLLARDGTLRDLAAMSAHYRRVHATRPALELLASFFCESGVGVVHWYLDRPVSNSGRLKRLIEEAMEGREPPWTVKLTDRTDRRLAESQRVVGTADSAILDRCRSWVNLARIIVNRSIPDAWVVDLREP